MSNEPLRLGIAGVSHGHVKTIDRRKGKGIAVVGVYEGDAELRRAYGGSRRLDDALLFDDLGKMIEATRPEAVAAFGSIAEHLAVVEACAPRGVHVMVEKPLSVRPEDARRMASLARDHGIHLLTNYETTWYPTTHRAFDLVAAGEVGAIRKIVVHDGHRGPIEIGCSPEFLAWLTGSTELGGGALIDFGCYGANLATRLMNGAAPLRVTAVTGQLKPELYPHVEDNATIILTYPTAEVVIQASWNWPVSRKDIEIYGESGVLQAVDAVMLRRRRGDTAIEEVVRLDSLPAPLDEPFTHLAAVARGELLLADDDLSAVTNNVLVVEILEAAHRSARLGQTVAFAPG